MIHAPKITAQQGWPPHPQLPMVLLLVIIALPRLPKPSRLPLNLPLSFLCIIQHFVRQLQNNWSQVNAYDLHLFAKDNVSSQAKGVYESYHCQTPVSTHLTLHKSLHSHWCSGFWRTEMACANVVPPTSLESRIYFNEGPVSLAHFACSQMKIECPTTMIMFLLCEVIHYHRLVCHLHEYVGFPNIKAHGVGQPTTYL